MPWSAPDFAPVSSVVAGVKSLSALDALVDISNGGALLVSGHSPFGVKLSDAAHPYCSDCADYCQDRPEDESYIRHPVQHICER